ncbi:MAG: mycothiol synthase [Flaviflexus sp.]|nr:mycothiol synthase [Flaviflexus sp.]
MRASTRRPDLQDFEDFARAVDRADGVEAFGEASFRDVSEDRPARYLALYDPQLIGLAIMGREGTELAVHPERRGEGFGRMLAEQAVQIARPLRLWAHGNLEQAQGLAASLGLEPMRELVQMRSGEDIPDLAEETARIEELGVRLATYPAAECEDPQELVALNARAFAEHPEQGAMTAADIAARGGTITLARSGERLVGFLWIQEEPPELYVLGVDPDFQGRGLGSRLTRLAQAQLGVPATLFVEGDNGPALSAYERAGFVRIRTDIQYEAPAD